jgi:hypothetical protein
MAVHPHVRLWVRRFFAIVLFALFSIIDGGLLYLHLCRDFLGASIAAAVVAALVGYAFAVVNRLIRWILGFIFSLQEVSAGRQG